MSTHKILSVKDIEFIKNNPFRSNSELAEMLGATPNQIQGIRQREGLKNVQRKEFTLEDEINELTYEIEAIQNKMNWRIKTAESRQRKLKAQLDEKKQYLRELKAIAS